MAFRFSLIFFATLLLALKYMATARAMTSGVSKGKMKSIGMAKTPMSRAFTMLLATCISGEMFMPTDFRSVSSCILLYSFNRRRFDIHMARSCNQISIVLVFFFCCLARFPAAFEVEKNGTRKQSARTRKSPTPSSAPMIACKMIILAPPYFLYSTGFVYFSISKAVMMITIPHTARTILPGIVSISE